MADFFLEPDDVEPERPERRRPVRLVSTGLADTAEVPRSAKPAPPPCYVPCEACGQAVLHGTTDAGLRLGLDTQVSTYLVDWSAGTPVPALQVSRAYPVHRCHTLGETVYAAPNRVDSEERTDGGEGRTTGVPWRPAPPRDHGPR